MTALGLVPTVLPALPALPVVSSGGVVAVAHEFVVPGVEHTMVVAPVTSLYLSVLCIHQI